MARVHVSPFTQSMEDGTFWVEETPVGSVNGSNTSFTLTYSPNPVSSAEYLVNGQEVVYGADKDYTISADALTTVYAYPNGTTHRIRYRVEPS